MTRVAFDALLLGLDFKNALFRYTRTHRDTVSALVMPSVTVKHRLDSFFHRGGHFFINDLIIVFGGRNLSRVDGPSADTGGLPQNKASVVYRYSSIEELITEEERGGKSPVLPGHGPNKPIERPYE